MANRVSTKQTGGHNGNEESGALQAQCRIEGRGCSGLSPARMSARLPAHLNSRIDELLMNRRFAPDLYLPLAPDEVPALLTLSAPFPAQRP